MDARARLRLTSFSASAPIPPTVILPSPNAQTRVQTNGIAVVRFLREQKLELPVVACTAFYDAKNASLFSDAGFDAVLSKPFTQTQLAATLRKVIVARHERTKAALAAAAMASCPAALVQAGILPTLPPGGASPKLQLK